ncbi:hypothetical protein ABE137_23190 [Brevibacillus laterosporus]|nr:hypothetical protein [Brevibacillus halotolerans]GIO02211.1 hypothetical protein J5TS2_28790 [Brevibacillus halotolerans]
MRKKYALMVLSLSLIANILVLSVDEIKPAENQVFVRANNADPGH